MTHARGTTCRTGDWRAGILGRARGYSKSALEDVIGLLFLAVYIVGIVGLAAGITFGVIKIFPTERNPKKKDGTETPEKPKPSANSGGDSGGGGGGTLFRRSKRGS